MADGWNPLKQPTNTAQINGKRTPHCEFASEGFKNEIENKHVNGSFGQFTEVKGREIPAYTLTFTLLTDDDWNLWEAIRREVDVLGKATNSPASYWGWGQRQAKAYSVVHPQVQDLGIVSSTFVGRSPVQDNGKGLWQVATHWQQWARLRPVRSRLDGANGPARSGRADDEQDQQIRDRLAQVDALSGT